MTSKLIASAKNENLKVIGPVRHPTKILRVTVRRSPCGNGTQTFDRFEMRIHKRVVHLICPAEYIKKVTDFTIEPGVEVELHFTDVYLVTRLLYIALEFINSWMICIFCIFILVLVHFL